MKNKRYMIDFTASITGTVLIRGRSKAEAIKNLKIADHVGDQLEDYLYDLKPSEFDIKFDERSIVLDEDEGSDPYTGGDEEE